MKKYYLSYGKHDFQINQPLYLALFDVLNENSITFNVFKRYSSDETSVILTIFDDAPLFIINYLWEHLN